MKRYLLNIDKKCLRIIKTISSQAEKNDIRAYLVGGIVRDILLKKKSFDLDIVVESSAISWARELAVSFNARCVAHKAFGTASLFLEKEGLRIDLVTARSETYRFPGALPTVHPGTLQEDLFRRDFTINAMAISLNKSSWGELIDPFGGVKDLKDRKIRVLHDKSFIDDPTRILRAVRFEQRLSFYIENETKVLLKEALQKDCFAHVNVFRSFLEFKKILMEVPVKGLKRLNSFNAMEFLIERKKLTLSSVLRVGKSCCDEESKCWHVYLMALMKDMPGEQKELLLRKFSFSKKERKAFSQSGQIEDVFHQLSKKDLTLTQLYAILKLFFKEVIIYFFLMSRGKKINERIETFLKEHV